MLGLQKRDVTKDENLTLLLEEAEVTRQHGIGAVKEWARSTGQVVPEFDPRPLKKDALFELWGE